MADQPRAIVHLDLDAFFAAVEVLENPALAGKPVVVGGRPAERGVVSAASYPARHYGIRSAMPMTRALRLCPVAVVLPVRHSLYQSYSHRVMEILHQSAPLVEQMSIDEAFLDLTNSLASWQESVAVARRLQQRVRDEVGLSASLGVAANKLVAKIASDRDKPGGLTVVQPGEERGFLAPLPVHVLWGVGPVTAGRLAEMGLETVGDLAAAEEEVLRARFGRHGAELARQASGLDDRPLVTEHVCKSVSQEWTFARDVADRQVLQRQLWKLCQAVAQRLGKVGLEAGSVAIKLRYADFTTLTRQMRLDEPTCDEKRVYRAAGLLLERAWQAGRPVRLLGVAGRELARPSGQLSLW